MSTQTKTGGEKSLLGVTKKSHGRSYGSTKKSTQDIYIKHIVTPSDTLAGIALKYSVTVEQIKRANKLYTNDSIFLRSTLSIPVGDQPLPAHVLENATSRANGSPIHKVAADTVLFDSSDEEEECDEKRDDSVVVEETRDVQMDFFNRIDRQVREGKTHLDKIETTSSVPEIEAISPNIQSSPNKPSPTRISSTAGAYKDNSYQNSMVSVNADSGKRRGNEFSEISRGGASKDFELKIISKPR
ncbi:lysM and putative peptidoglycan-binding domain-containing protein 2-like isoform X2 [Acanthaster planci]|uniref:LysM and putative peptidoglycan-binding domain-containing protein 2-like isoform X2 n=1 Tax=Acanthaster planci TaxID=133434 RepID=A0A8B7XWE4_ACAPL|nr:lysM and putative peptidoglycan-binding domain-containing protein 2-like isoform X2 [Acanthaster planci]